MVDEASSVPDSAGCTKPLPWIHTQEAREALSLHTAVRTEAISADAYRYTHTHTRSRAHVRACAAHLMTPLLIPAGGRTAPAIAVASSPHSCRCRPRRRRVWLGQRLLRGQRPGARSFSGQARLSKYIDGRDGVKGRREIAPSLVAHGCIALLYEPGVFCFSRCCRWILMPVAAWIILGAGGIGPVRRGSEDLFSDSYSKRTEVRALV